MSKKSKQQMSPADVAEEATLDSLVKPKDPSVEEIEEALEEAQDTPEVVEEKSAPVEEVEPVKEERPEPPPKAAAESPQPKAAPSAPKVVEPVTDKYLLGMQTAISRYRELYNTKIVTPEIKKRIVKAFSDIMFAALNHPTPAVLNECFSFFVQERTALLHPTEALQGLEKLQKNTRQRVEAFYTIFSQAVKTKLGKTKIKLDLEKVRKVIKSDAVLNFIASKTN